MEKLNIILITIYLVKLYQCTSNQTSNKQHFVTDSVATYKSSFQPPKVIRNTGFDIKLSSNETEQNNISETIKQDYEKRPVSVNKGDHLSNFSGEWNKSLLQSAKSTVKNIVNRKENYRQSKNTSIDNTNGNFDTLDVQTEIPNMNGPEGNVTATETENSDKIADDEILVNQNAEEMENNITYNVSEPAKIKLLNITANLEITLQNNLHKILGSLKAEKGKYLLPHLMEKFESTVLRPIKDTLETIHIELSPEYNNNYGSQIQPNTPLFLQKLQEKKQKILNHFGIRCCNYDYPYPY